jgi:multidrug efflux system membrane fusion protein
VPVTAVRHGTQGDFVFVLQGDHTVKMQAVKQGPADGTNVAILSGLTVGQTVITEGADNLEDGSKVMLPGERPQFPRRKKGGLFSWLFGGGGDQNGPGGPGGPGGGQGRWRHGQGGQGGADGGGNEAGGPGGAPGQHQGGHRHRQQGGGGGQ